MLAHSQKTEVKLSDDSLASDRWETTEGGGIGNKGTGLGLFVAKQICEQYGGRITFSSSSKGTAFSLNFPRVEAVL